MSSGGFDWLGVAVVLAVVAAVCVFIRAIPGKVFNLGCLFVVVAYGLAFIVLNAGTWR